MIMNLNDFFDAGKTIYHASAPGRLDVMGGIADYSGSLVLQMPIEQCANAWLALRDDGCVRVRSASVEALGLQAEINVELKKFFENGNLLDYAECCKTFSAIKGGEWSAYAIGCVLVLIKEKGIEIPGVDILIQSDVPIGKGVSSSAAIEVAVMSALAEACQLDLDPVELPLLAQIVENRVVGAPCGIMDQLASYLGMENRLLPILCQPVQVFDPICIPEPIRFVGIDSGVRHAVSGASYSDVRTAAYMGYSIIALNEGAGVGDITNAKASCDWSALPYGGYLANIDVSLFESRFQSLLPIRISGKEFLDRYGDIIDSITSVDPDNQYAVQTCAAHPVYENHRVNSFMQMLKTLAEQDASSIQIPKILRMLGDFMFQSHSSYSACGLGCEGTDDIVTAVCDSGIKSGVYGAKITGGGSGGTVCVLCEDQAGLETAQRIAQEYSDKKGIDPFLFIGSGQGARSKGVKTIANDRF